MNWKITLKLLKTPEKLGRLSGVLAYEHYFNLLDLNKKNLKVIKMERS